MISEKRIAAFGKIMLQRRVNIGRAKRAVEATGEWK
jgi:hypothetical protein